MCWKQIIGYANINICILGLIKSTSLHILICALVTGRREVKSGQVQDIFTCVPVPVLWSGMCSCFMIWENNIIFYNTWWFRESQSSNWCTNNCGWVFAVAPFGGCQKRKSLFWLPSRIPSSAVAGCPAVLVQGYLCSGRCYLCAYP